MVILNRRGVERHPALVILLSLVTFGLYLPYWYYASHKELYEQFELQEDRKETGFVWLLYGHVVLKPLLFVYEWILVANIVHVRQRMGFEKSLRPGAVIGMTISAMVLGVVLMFTGYAIFLTGIPDPDDNLSQSDQDDALLEALGKALPFLLAAIVVPLVLRLLAYGLVQAQLNQLWRAFDSRIEELVPITDS